MFNKLLRWLKPNTKSLINELSVDKLTAGTLTATVRVSDKPTELMQATCSTDAVKACTLAAMPSLSHGKTVSWWSLVDGKVAPQSIVLDRAWIGDDTTVVYLEDNNGDSHTVGTDTLVHVIETKGYGE